MEDLNLSRVLKDAIERQERVIAALEAISSTSGRLNDAQKTLAALVGQGRAMAKDSARWARSLGPEERREAIVAWFDSLPDQQQRLLLQELTQSYNRKVA